MLLTNYEQLIELLKIKDDDLEDFNIYFIYIKDMCELIARLISLYDLNTITEVEDYYSNYLDENGIDDENQIIRSDIKRAFDYAKKLVNKFDYKRS